MRKSKCLENYRSDFAYIQYYITSEVFLTYAGVVLMISLFFVIFIFLTNYGDVDFHRFFIPKNAAVHMDGC